MAQRFSQDEKDLIKSLLSENKSCDIISEELEKQFKTKRNVKSLYNQINSNRHFYGHSQEKKKVEKTIRNFESNVKNNKFEILNQPQHIDELSRDAGLPSSMVSSTLTLMELKGMIRQVGSMNYVLAREPDPEYDVFHH